MYYTFLDFRDDCNNLVHQIQSSNKKFDYIVGIVRGGSIPAVYLSHRLNLPMRNVSWSTFHPSQMKEHAYDIAEDVSEGKKILLVDDIVDSGKTMIQLLDDWGCKQSDLSIACLIYNVVQPIVPDFYARTIDRRVDSEWVDFWWEKGNG